MSQFRFVPTQGDMTPLEFEGDEVSLGFSRAQRQGIAEAEVWRDGEYFCSIRLSPTEDSGFWMMFQREGSK